MDASPFYRHIAPLERKAIDGRGDPAPTLLYDFLDERILNVLGLTHFGTVGAGQDAPSTVGCVSPVLMMFSGIRPVWGTRRAWLFR